MRKEPQTITEAQKLLKKHSAMLSVAIEESKAGKRNKMLVLRLTKLRDYYLEIIPKMSQEKKSYLKVSNKIKGYQSEETNEEPTHMVLEADNMGEDTEAQQPIFYGSKRQCQSYINASGLITLKIVRYE
jgi:hypothetical protein